MVTLGLETNDFLKLMTDHPQSSRQFKGYTHLDVYNLISQVMNILILGLANMAFKNFPPLFIPLLSETTQVSRNIRESGKKLSTVTIDFGGHQMTDVSGRWHHVRVKSKWTKQGES